MKMDYDELIQDNSDDSNGKDIFYHPTSLIRYHREIKKVPVTFYVYLYGKIVCQYTGLLLNDLKPENAKSIFYNIKIHKAELFVEGKADCPYAYHPLNASVCDGVHIGRELSNLDFKLKEDEKWFNLTSDQFPQEILAHIPSISSEKFIISLNAPQLLEPNINRLRHFIDDQNISGQFTAYCQGYFTKSDEEETFEYIPIVEKWLYTGNYEYRDEAEDEIRFEERYTNSRVNPNFRWTNWMNVHKEKALQDPIWVKTGVVEWNACAYREELKNINPLYYGNQTHWSEWQADPEKQFEGDWVRTENTRCIGGYIEEEYKNSNPCYNPNVKWKKTGIKCSNNYPNNSNSTANLDNLFDGCFFAFKCNSQDLI